MEYINILLEILKVILFTMSFLSFNISIIDSIIFGVLATIIYDTIVKIFAGKEKWHKNFVPSVELLWYLLEK